VIYCFSRVIHTIATLLYCFNEREEVLLMERTREPNRALWSPCGGKLQTEIGESPYACACREAAEELGLMITPRDLHLLGLVTETSSEGQPHWLMFLFEVKPRLRSLPPPHDEGRFSFFSREQLQGLKMPRTDVEQIWPLVWEHRNGFFAAHCLSSSDGADMWTVEESFSAKANDD
jgi:8-oxo-dGTP diphosphatase